THLWRRNPLCRRPPTRLVAMVVDRVQNVIAGEAECDVEVSRLPTPEVHAADVRAGLREHRCGIVFPPRRRPVDKTGSPAIEEPERGGDPGRVDALHSRWILHRHLHDRYRALSLR